MAAPGHFQPSYRKLSLVFFLGLSSPKVAGYATQSYASFSSYIVRDEPILVRDFIHSALYDTNHGYFSKSCGSVGVLDSGIKFNQLQGRKAYLRHLDKIYKQSDTSWFTPVELFKPWYAHGIAEAILRTANLSYPLKIYEIGGGSGTCAKGLMDYIKLNAPPRIYDSLTYTSVEISSTLAQKQMETVGQVSSHLPKFKVEHRDAADRGGWGDVQKQPCWVIMLEVLDNLPHDLIYSENQVSPWKEVWVEKQPDRLLPSELYKPVQDSLIKSCMEILDMNSSARGGTLASTTRGLWAKVFPKPRRCWLPTGSLKLMNALHSAIPKMSLIASDFSCLPDIRSPGERAPLVATKKDGSSSDYDSYLEAKGDANIFFPTDFWLLEQIDHYCSSWLEVNKDTASKQIKKRRMITASKLVDLYKESSEEWSKKAGELEGVIKALETHLSQLQNEHKEKIEKEEALRREAEKVAAELKEKLERCETELESNRKAREFRILPLSSFSGEGWVETYDSVDSAIDSAIDNPILGPSIPPGVSGTALAASLIRDGWSLAKMYTKYQEAIDALRHEQLGRKQSQAVLERVLLEIEEKASVILDERAEHERMAEAYDLMNEKLRESQYEQAKLEKVIQELKADLRKRERDCNLTHKEVVDLQKQVTVLLKECRDVQLRCGSAGNGHAEYDMTSLVADINAEGDAEKVISEHLINFTSINGLVEQNVRLRSLVRSLSSEIENKDNELKEQFDIELQKRNEEAASKVAAVLERAEQQAQMIESLHSSVAMYKRLYEEEHKLRSSELPASLTAPADGRKEQVLLLESPQNFQNSAKKVQEQFAERVHLLEEELTTLRSEIISVRGERDKYILESSFSREKMERYVKDMDHQREEMNGILSRNVEFQRLIVDYQKQLRESSQSLLAAEERARKLNVEVSVLSREKELLQNSERRACDEVRALSERVHRLQASLETMHATDQVHEEARAAERKKLEEHIKHIEREWAEAKKELQAERDNVRVLSLDRDNSMKDAMRQIEQMGKDLAGALQAVSAAETRAATSEARFVDLERKLMSSSAKASERDDGTQDLPSSASETMRDLSMAREEIERLKLEAQANRDHMLQYKNIADLNEAALKQMESSFELFRTEAEKRKNSLEEEISSLRDRVLQLENESSLRSEEAVSAASEKEAAFASSLVEIANLKEEMSSKMSQFALMEVQISSLKADLEKEHQKWRAAQENYERQVILQAETIQELTKTSDALALLKEESSQHRRLADTYKSQNDELKAKWEVEKSELEQRKTDAEKKYDELNEQNKILHTRLEAMHIRSAERDRQTAGITSPAATTESESDSGLQSVVSYLRRSKEIAETEISLLKQEKLRLQSQLERVLKEAEAAQASLGEERANARSLIFTEEDFKSLQLQVREMNLLRESNMQLREENKYNFEECKKLREVAEKERIEAENLSNLLREKETVAEALRREIDVVKEEKELSEQRISELLEKSKNIDVEEHIQLKSDYQQMQVNIQEKEKQIEELRSLLSEKVEMISKLEHELEAVRTQFTEKEKTASQIEANLKADLEKQKKFNLQLKRRIDSISKEKESLLKEKEVLSKDRDTLSKEKDSLMKEKESLLTEKELVYKEKEDKGREIQGLLKQLEDSRQENKPIGDGEYQTLVNEKDKRIQSLEKTIERERDEKRKEKERRLLTEKAITAKVTSLDQEKKRVEHEQGKHRDAVKRISDELEKLKHARDSLPEGTSVIQLLSNSVLDDLASSYLSAVQSFETSASSILVELGAHTASTTVAETSTLAGPVSNAPVQAAPVPVSTASPTRQPSRTADDGEKKTVAPRITAETRRLGRRLVRPRLAKSEEPQGDSEMADTEGPSNTGKAAPSGDTETQVTHAVAVEPQARKRTAASSASELHDESSKQALPGSDIARSLKRSKGVEPTQKDAQGQPGVETPVASEDVPDAATNLPPGTTEDLKGAEKDDTDASQGQTEEPKQPQQLDEVQALCCDGTTENVDKSNEDAVLEEASPQPLEDVGEPEEGELPEIPSFETTVDDVLESLPQILPADEEESLASVTDNVNETAPEDLNSEKLEEGEVPDDNADASDKSNDGNDQIGGEAEQGSETAAVTEASREGSAAATASSSTTINLHARAKERAAQRLANISSPATRGRGRSLRGRGRVVRGGRRPSSGDQG